MSKMIQINVNMTDSTRTTETRSVLVSRYDIESLWQTSQKDECIVRLVFAREGRSEVEQPYITDAEFERLSAILTKEEKES